MAAEQLQKHTHYRFTHSQSFRDISEYIRGFVERNYNLGMHVQDFFEINIIMRGQGIHYIRDGKTTAIRGDVFIIPPDTPHGYASSGEFDVYHLLISEHFMQKNISELQTLPSFFILFKAEPLMRPNASSIFHLNLSDEQLNQLETLLNHIENYSKVKSTTSKIKRNSLALLLIANLCEIYTENTISSNTEETVQDNAFAAALAIIYERFNEKISIADLAKTAQLSRSSFLRKFQIICKMPPAQFITLQRIEAAKHMLTYTDISVSDIANKTGFYDTSHFIKAFLADTGTTPNAYRKESR